MSLTSLRIHALVQSLPTLNNAELCKQKDPAEMTKWHFWVQVHKKYCDFHLAHSWTTYSGGSQLAGHQDTAAGLWEGTHGKELKLPANNSQCGCTILEADATAASLQMPAASVDILIATS